MKNQLQTIILVFVSVLITTSMFSQTDSFLNSNNIFDLGVTIGQLTFSNAEGINVDYYEQWAKRAEGKYEYAMVPAAGLISIDGFDPDSYDLEIMQERLSKIDKTADCGNPHFAGVENLYTAGFHLAQAFLIAGTDCTGCLSDALIDGEAAIFDLAHTLKNAGDDNTGTTLFEIAEHLQSLFSDLDFGLDLDANLEQNATVGQQVILIIGQMNNLFPNQLINCNNESQQPDSSSYEECHIDEMVSIAEDSLSKTYLVRGDSYFYHWRYRTEGGSWQEAEENDSILRLEISAGQIYEVQVRAMCNVTLDFTEYVSETIAYNYSYGCYPPSAHHLWVSHVQTTSTWLHASTTASHIEWAYRKVGSNWSFFKTGKKSLYYKNLTPATTYEFACRIWCGHDWSSWSSVKRWTTKGSYCTVYKPSVGSINSGSAVTSSSHSGKKQWAFRKKGGSWKYYINSYSWMKWTCQPNTSYEVCVRIPCHGKWSGWSNPVGWTTSGNHCYAPTYGSLSAYDITTTTATTHVNVSSSSYTWAIRKKGSNWQYFKDNDPTIHWQGLSPNTIYEYKVKIYCNGYWTYYSSLKQFTTKGYACQTPKAQDIWYNSLTSSSVKLHISTSATSIEYALKRSGSDWNMWTRTSKSVQFINLWSDQVYYYSMRVYCNGHWTDWAPVESFRTKQEGRSVVTSQGDEIVEDGTLPARTSKALEEVEELISADSSYVSHFSTEPSQYLEVSSGTPEMIIFPNPATEYFSINGIDSVASGKVTNMQGQVVLNFDAIESSHRINVGSLRSGYYQVIINNLDGTQTTKKLSIIK